MTTVALPAGTGEIRNSPPSPEIVVCRVSWISIWALRRYSPVTGLKTRPVMVPVAEDCAWSWRDDRARNDAPRRARTVMHFMRATREYRGQGLVVEYNRPGEP